MNDSSPIHVLCTRTFSPAQLDLLRAVSPRLVIEQRFAKDRASLAATFSPEVEVLFTSFPPESLAALPRLRWVQTRGAGINAYVGSPVWTSDVRLTSMSGLHGVPIGEWTIGMMIALTRDFGKMETYRRDAHWPKANQAEFNSPLLRGRTLLVVGYGSIGREIARLARALGLRVLAVKRDPSQRLDRRFVFPGTGDPDGTCPEKIGGAGDLRTFLPEADFVVLSTPLTNATTALIGESELSLLRPSAFVLNIARGEVIDEPALIRALQEKRLAGAALDVFAREPLPADSPLWRLPNVLMSPHIAGHTRDYDQLAAEIFAANLRKYLHGEELFNLVDRQRGY